MRRPLIAAFAALAVLAIRRRKPGRDGAQPLGEWAASGKAAGEEALSTLATAVTRQL